MGRLRAFIASCLRRCFSAASVRDPRSPSALQVCEFLRQANVTSVVAEVARGVAAEIPVRSHLCRAQLAGGFERDHLTILRRALRAGDHAVDVGANIGFTTCVIADRVGPRGRVLCIEPLQACRVVLSRNLARNALADRVVVKGICAGASRGQVDLHVPEGNEEYSSVGGVVHPSIQTATRVERCEVETVDEMCRLEGIRPALVKIDTEGYEYAVLQGMQGLLAGVRPMISIELVPAMLTAGGSAPSRVVKLLSDHRYRLFDLGLQPAVASEIGAGGNYQYLALPEENVAEVFARCTQSDSQELP